MPPKPPTPNPVPRSCKIAQSEWKDYIKIRLYYRGKAGCLESFYSARWVYATWKTPTFIHFFSFNAIHLKICNNIELTIP